MQWYYVREGQRLGPIDEMELRTLAAQQIVTPDTLVWNPDMSDWGRFGEAVLSEIRQATQPASGACAECGREFPWERLVTFGRVQVCGECKPLFFQRVQQGTVYPVAMPYGGFWIRACAKIADFAILGVLQTAIQMGLLKMVSSGNLQLTMLFSALTGLFSLVLTIGYDTWFIGRFGATPGKMACGLRVVFSDGSRISYLRALGRALGSLLSGAVLYIGYAVAAFDEQKRALHDFFCDTRVVRER